MPKVIFKQPDGSQQEVDVPVGHSAMEAAIDNNIPGIVAECGGACACATCHAYVDEAWAAKLPVAEDMEDAMLDAALERRATSRLTCQIEITDELDGIVLEVADNNL